MTLVLPINCPFCGATKVACECRFALEIAANPLALKPRDANIEATGVCSGCRSVVLLYFAARNARGLVDICGIDQSVGYYALPETRDGRTRLVGILPTPPKPHIPQHLPAPVERALREAEEARLHRLWSAAAGHYRKAVDRAVTHVLREAGLVEDGDRSMLGRKLAMLEKTGLLPVPMLDWIRLVKDDGNFALHDADRDFDTGGEIEPARRFTIVLLEYLFTLPEEVRRAREGAGEG